MKKDLMTLLGGERRLVVEAVMALERALWHTHSQGACASLDDTPTSQFRIEMGPLDSALRVELQSGGFQFGDEDAANLLVRSLVDSLPEAGESTKTTRLIDSAAFVTSKQLQSSLRSCHYQWADLKYFAIRPVVERHFGAIDPPAGWGHQYCDGEFFGPQACPA
jgi:hypothetical protein